MRRGFASACSLWVALFLTLVSGCASLSGVAEKPRVNIVNITPKEMRLMEQTFLMELRIMNPLEEDLDITGISLDLEVNGQPFAWGVSNQSLKVERLSTKIVQMEAYTGLSSILRQLAEASKGNYAEGITYRLKGSVFLGSPSSRIAFDEAGEFR